MKPQGDPITPAGMAALKARYDHLLGTERPEIVEIVSWAAGNGDRSENGDYIYNKKRLREIDRRMRYLIKKLENTEVVDPKDQQGQTRVFFGAHVTYVREDDSEITVHLVDVDEAGFDAKTGQGKINWHSPVGKALLKHEVGDEVKVRTEGGEEYIEILKIEYRIEEDE